MPSIQGARATKAFRKKPEFGTAHNNLGDALLAQGKLDLAVAAFREASRQKPADAWAHNNLGFALQAQGKVDQAIVEYREAIRLEPDFAKAHLNLGAVLCDVKHDYREAESDFRTVIRHKVAWMKQQKSPDADLLPVWTEAAKLLGRPGPEATDQKHAPDPKEKP